MPTYQYRVYLSVGIHRASMAVYESMSVATRGVRNQDFDFDTISIRN